MYLSALVDADGAHLLAAPPPRADVGVRPRALAVSCSRCAIS